LNVCVSYFRRRRFFGRPIRDALSNLLCWHVFFKHPCTRPVEVVVLISAKCSKNDVQINFVVAVFLRTQDAQEAKEIVQACTSYK
jgi:hypothetical protein